ncbi:MAG: ABC transporter permease [Actinobacteria bacterium]|nr:ABC transporter permease [Actinomycetota bacterium]MCG2802932.1 ABC transporter permease [Cellulomonas sp.]
MSDVLERPGRWTRRLAPRGERSPWRQPLAVLGAVVLVVWLLVAALAPLLAPFDPLEQSGDRLAAPGGAHLLGTDSLGRDVLSRVVFGSRLSIPVAVALVVGCLVVGAVLGALAGYLGGWVDEVVMRVADMVLAFPTIILAMVVAAALGPSLVNAVIAILLVNWPQYARVTRSLVLGAKTREYVVAGRLLGAGPWTSLRRDILPNVAAPVLVLATLDVGSAILVLSGLSFLGLGTVPPTPEWGSMVADGVQQFDAWWIGTSAGLAILSVVAAVNFVGDALRDALDPHTRSTVAGRAL